MEEGLGPIRTASPHGPPAQTTAETMLTREGFGREL